MSDIPLNKQYANVLAKVESLEHTSLRQDSPEFQEELLDTINTITTLKSRINSLSLFSDNEGIEELTTNEIKYLGIDYHTGDLFVKNSQGGKTINLNIAKNLYLQFLLNLDNYSILFKEQSNKLHDFKSSSTQELEELSTRDPTKRRQEKVSNYRYEKELQTRLAILEDTNKLYNLDEYVVRNLYIDQLRLFSVKTFAKLELLQMEMEVLKNKPDPKIEEILPPQDSRVKSKGDSLKYTDKLESLNRPLLSKTGKILRPFVIYSTRDQLKRKVYGTGQELPSMSVEEYLDIELANGKMIKPEEPEEEFNEEDEDQVDKQTYHERYWDEFKENNTRGSGNTMNLG